MSTDSFFGEVIHAYTRQQAIADGVLVDVTKVAREAGFSIPVAMTHSVYEDCVAWTEADNDRKGTLQDEAGRLWDCVWMAFVAARRGRGEDRATVTVHRVPRHGRGLTPRPVSFIMAIGPGDNAEPVITLMFPEDD